MKKRPIANEITGEDDDAYCSVCGDDTLVVRLDADENCREFCAGPPEIFLCSHCLARMLTEIKDLNL